MITQIHKPQSHSNNKGSSSNAVEYLEKENSDRNFAESEYFFNQFDNKVSGNQVQNMLDRNKGRLSKNETKFYMLTISPSPNELERIGSNDINLKNFVNNVMDDYARNFNREYSENMPLTGNDLMYFAKLETERSYKFKNKKDKVLIEFNRSIFKEIELNKTLIEKKPHLKKHLTRENNNLTVQLKRNSQGKAIKEGVLKDGDQRHVHILVSRYDLQQRFKLSPLANARNTKSKEVGVGDNRKKIQAGFDRDKFVQMVETRFDNEFQYDRPYDKSYAFHKASKGLSTGIGLITNPIGTVKGLVVSKVANEISKQIKSPIGKKAFAIARTNPSKIPAKTLNKIQDLAVKELMTAVNMSAYSNPATAVANIVTKSIKLIGQQITKGAGI